MIRNVILDTKVFVLFVIGSIDSKYIKKFVRTKEFSEEEFVLLKQAISSYNNILITPHILTEFSHFTIEEKSFRDDYKKIIKNFILEIGKINLKEKQVDLSKIFNNEGVYYLGVADISLVESCCDEDMVITSDGALADRLRVEGKTALKFIPTKGFVNY